MDKLNVHTGGMLSCVPFSSVIVPFASPFDWKAACSYLFPVSSEEASVHSRQNTDCSQKKKKSISETMNSYRSIGKIMAFYGTKMCTSLLQMSQKAVLMVSPT